MDNAISQAEQIIKKTQAEISILKAPDRKEEERRAKIAALEQQHNEALSTVARQRRQAAVTEFCQVRAKLYQQIEQAKAEWADKVSEAHEAHLRCIELREALLKIESRHQQRDASVKEISEICRSCGIDPELVTRHVSTFRNLPEDIQRFLPELAKPRRKPINTSLD